MITLVTILEPLDQKIHKATEKLFNYIEINRVEYNNKVNKFDFFSNVILFFILITYICVQLLFIIDEKYYIMGWLFVFLVFWPIICIIKLLSSFSILYNYKEHFLPDDPEKDHKGSFIKTFFSFIYINLINIGKFIPFILINSLIYTMIKILPFNNSFIGIGVSIILSIFCLYLLMISILRKTFKLTRPLLANSLLYLISLILLLYIGISFISTIYDNILSKILWTQEKYKIYKDQTDINNRINKFFILNDLRHESALDMFQYFLNMLIFIIIFIFTFFTIFLFHTKCKMNICKNENDDPDEDFFTNKVNENMKRLLDNIIKKLNFQKFLLKLI